MHNVTLTRHRSHRIAPGHHTAKGSRQTVATGLVSHQNRGAHALAVVGHGGSFGNVLDNAAPQDGRADVTGL